MPDPTTRYYAETECVHNKTGECGMSLGAWNSSETGRIIHVEKCPGGSRVLLTGRGVDYRAAAIEWIGDEPPDNYPGEWEQMITSVIEQTVKPIIDAALGGSEGLLLETDRD